MGGTFLVSRRWSPCQSFYRSVFSASESLELNFRDEMMLQFYEPTHLMETICLYPHLSGRWQVIMIQESVLLNLNDVKMPTP